MKNKKKKVQKNGSNSKLKLAKQKDRAEMKKIKSQQKHEYKMATSKGKGRTARTAMASTTVGSIAQSKYDAQKHIASEESKARQANAAAFQSSISQLLNPSSIRDTVSSEPDLGKEDEEKDTSLVFPNYNRR